MNKTFEIRCSNKRPTRAGEVVCRRFLAKIDERSIQLPCPRCGRKYLIILNQNGTYRAVRLPDEKLLDPKPPEPTKE